MGVTMKKILLLFFVFYAPFLAAQPVSEIGPYIEGYNGPKLEEVWLLRIGPRSENTFLVQIAGVDHEWDNTIVKCEKKGGEGLSAVYSVMYNNAPHVLITQKSYTELELHLPAERTTIPLKYSKELSLEGNKEAFLADYLAAQQRAK